MTGADAVARHVHLADGLAVLAFLSAAGGHVDRASDVLARIKDRCEQAEPRVAWLAVGAHLMRVFAEMGIVKAGGCLNTSHDHQIAFRFTPSEGFCDEWVGLAEDCARLVAARMAGDDDMWVALGRELVRRHGMDHAVRMVLHVAAWELPGVQLVSPEEWDREYRVEVPDSPGGMTDRG